MAITKSIIVVEDRLQEIFSYLPPFIDVNGNNYNALFKYGDDKELYSFFKSNKSIDSPYPLIWLVYPYTEQHKINRVVLDKISIVLAIDTNVEMLNDERLSLTYKQILFPLFNNIKDLFKMANIITVNKNYDIVKFPNYGENDKSINVDIWDAMKITFSCYITDKKLAPISLPGHTIVLPAGMPSLVEVAPSEILTL